MNNIKCLLFLLCLFTIKTAHAQTTSITIDTILLKLTVTTQEDKKLKTKIIFENLGNHKIKSCFTNKEGNADFVLPSEAKYKITIPASDDSYEYEIPEFTISPLAVTFKFRLRPANNALVGINVLNNKAKTGKGPEEFKKLADKKGFTKKGRLKEGIKARETVNRLKEKFDLGHGHAMAVYALFK